MKGLEALERIERDMEYITRLDFVEPIVRGQVQQELYKIYHREEKDLDIIEKELKALEIIRKNHTITFDIKYELDMGFLTKEEYELLKEVLK